VSEDGRLCLKCDGTRAEIRFRLSAKRTSPFKSVGASVQSTTGSRGVRIGCSNAGYIMFRSSVKGTGYPLHSPVSPSLPLPCVTVCHHISTELYQVSMILKNLQISLSPNHNRQFIEVPNYLRQELKCNKMKRKYCLPVFKSSLNFIHVRVSPIVWSSDFNPCFVFGRPRVDFMARRQLILIDTFDFSPSFFTSNGNTPRLTQYRGAGKSLALPGRKQATFLAFYGNWRFITTLTRVRHLSLP